jgi:hypothetical protein
MSNPIVAKAVFTRAPGYLYFIDKQGDVSRRKRNPGHYDSDAYDFPNEKVVRVGIAKQKGLWYYVEGNNIRTVCPRNSKRKPGKALDKKK